MGISSINCTFTFSGKFHIVCEDMFLAHSELLLQIKVAKNLSLPKKMSRDLKFLISLMDKKENFNMSSQRHHLFNSAFLLQRQLLQMQIVQASKNVCFCISNVEWTAEASL